MTDRFDSNYMAFSDVQRKATAAYLEIYARHLMWRFQLNLDASRVAPDIDSKSLLVERGQAMLTEIEQVDAQYEAFGLGRLLRTLLPDEPELRKLSWPEACALIWLADQFALALGANLTKEAHSSLAALDKRLHDSHRRLGDESEFLIREHGTACSASELCDRTLSLLTSRFTGPEPQAWSLAHRFGLLQSNACTVCEDFVTDIHHRLTAMDREPGPRADGHS